MHKSHTLKHIEDEFIEQRSYPTIQCFSYNSVEIPARLDLINYHMAVKDQQKAAGKQFPGHGYAVVESD
jgi:hypothetical protein